MPEVSVNHSVTDHRGLKSKLHTQLLEEIDLESLNRLSEGVARERVGVIIRDMLHRERTPLASVERERIVVEILDELFGLGPLEPLLVDGRLPDGSRVNAIIPPLSLDGPILSIRRFGRERLNAQSLLTYGSVSQQMLELLEGCVKGKLNIMISGGTGAGKTTFLNI